MEVSYGYSFSVGCTCICYFFCFVLLCFVFLISKSHRGWIDNNNIFFIVLHLIKTWYEPFYCFLSGSAGAGKSHLTKPCITLSRKFITTGLALIVLNVKVLLLASTGKEAYNITGNTTHSTIYKILIHRIFQAFLGSNKNCEDQTCSFRHAKHSCNTCVAVIKGRYSECKNQSCWLHNVFI